MNSTPLPASEMIGLFRFFHGNLLRVTLRSWRASALLVVALLAMSARPAMAQSPCPAVGKDTGCGVIITVTNTGASVFPTGQPPYDDIEDTLVGVINNSSRPVTSLELNAGLAVFSFDGDGIDTFGIPGNVLDNTGYGGPNAYFTNINGSQTVGTVNFIVPIAANGGTAYFSLEEAISSATACSSLINNALSGPNLISSTKIGATFTPKLGKTLSQAAQICGFTDFDWVQTITRLPDPSPYSARNFGFPYHLTSGSTPFNDPPAGGGYLDHPVDNSYPFYLDAFNGELKGHQTTTTLDFSDAPSDSCLPGPSGMPSQAYVSSAQVRARCGDSLAPVGSSIAFRTRLAGVLANGTPQDLGIGFTWTDNFNGTSGGISTTKNDLPVDPGSGEGGITILSVNQTTDYTGIVVSTVNGVSGGLPILSIDDMSVAEPDRGSVNAVFNVILSPASTQTVTVDYFTSNGTGTTPEDYQSVSGTLTFAPGQTTRTIAVPVNHDTTPRGNETFFVNLMNPASANILRGQGLGTIIDDDGVSIFQFSAPTGTALESADSATVTVVRTGDTTGPASVRFETSDGTARQKNRYIFGAGTVQFGAGEASKDVKILLVNEAIVEGSQNFRVTLSDPSGGGGVGNPASVVVTIIDDDTVPTALNPIDDAQFFVKQHYLDFLGREADQAGLAFWTSGITTCPDPACRAVKRVDTSAAFFFSTEFQETSGNIIRTQRVAFARQSADASSRVPYLQFMRDTRQVAQGVVVGQPGADALLEQNKQAYAEQVVTSPAFLTRFPIAPAAQYVDALCASAAVAPTSAERQAALTAFGLGGSAGRVAALRSIADSDTLRQAEFRPSLVLAQYYGYLRRNPTDAPDFNDAGYQFWLAKLNVFNGDFRAAEMIKAFISSAEYRQRFGQP